VVGKIIKYQYINEIKVFLSLLPPRPLGTPPPRRRGIEIVRISITTLVNYHLSNNK